MIHLKHHIRNKQMRMTHQEEEEPIGGMNEAPKEHKMYKKHLWMNIKWIISNEHMTK